MPELSSDLAAVHMDTGKTPLRYMTNVDMLMIATVEVTRSIAVLAARLPSVLVAPLLLTHRLVVHTTLHPSPEKARADTRAPLVMRRIMSVIIIKKK